MVDIGHIAPNSKDMSNQDNPQLFEVMQSEIAQAAFGVRTVIAAKVVNFKDSPRPMATIRLAPQVRKRPEGTAAIEWVQIPDLADVPVMEWKHGPFHIRANLEPGDTGIALIHDRDIDEWLEGGGREYRPGTALIHDINDALFLPALEPDTAAGSRKSPGARKMVIGDSNGTVCEIELDANTSSVNINATNVTLGSTGSPLPIARVGADQIVIPGGSSAGTYVIAPGPSGASNHKTKG